MFNDAGKEKRSSLRAMKADKMNDITLFLFSVNVVYISSDDRPE